MVGGYGTDTNTSQINGVLSNNNSDLNGMDLVSLFKQAVIALRRLVDRLAPREFYQKNVLNLPEAQTTTFNQNGDTFNTILCTLATGSVNVFLGQVTDPLTTPPDFNFSSANPGTHQIFLPKRSGQQVLVVSTDSSNAAFGCVILAQY